MHHEIIVNGKLFGVKCYTTINAEISFVGVFDEEEDKIALVIDALIEDKKHSSIPLQKILKVLFTPSAVFKNQYNFAFANMIIKKEFYN